MRNNEKILLVEDDLMDVELTLNALAENNITNDVVVARDGAEALDYLYRRGRFAARGDHDPLLVLLDIKLPKVDGLQVLDQLKGDERLRALPVVMLTSSNEEKDIVRSYHLGVNAYVVKPVDFDEFAAAIKQVGLFWTITNHPPQI
ncbi:MAG: response regulator [Blastocatellia bacterium]|nr:response regulator [Blastocatellia bacterium]